MPDKHTVGGRSDETSLGVQTMQLGHRGHSQGASVDRDIRGCFTEV